MINWKLIFLLSLFGVAMGLATLFGLIRGLAEMGLWLAIGVACAYWIARYAPARYFAHGYVSALLGWLWVGLLHDIFFSTYAANNVDEMQVFTTIPLPIKINSMLLLTAVIIGILFGFVVGLFALVVKRITNGKWKMKNGKL